MISALAGFSQPDGETRIRQRRLVVGAIGGWSAMEQVKRFVGFEPWM